MPSDKQIAQEQTRLVDCVVCGKQHETPVMKMFRMTIGTCPELREDQQAVIHGPTGADPFRPAAAPTETAAPQCTPPEGELNADTDDLWAANDWRYAFLQGAKWWEFQSRGATMWQSDQNLARAEAERRHAALPAAPAAQVCHWVTHPDTDCTAYETDCGQMWEFTEGGVEDNKMTFCCYCGKPIIEVVEDMYHDETE